MDAQAVLVLGFVAGKSSPLSGYSQTAKRLRCDQTGVKEMRDSCLPEAHKKNRKKTKTLLCLVVGTRTLSNLRWLLLDRLLSSEKSWLNGWGEVDLCSLFFLAILHSAGDYFHAYLC